MAELVRFHLDENVNLAVARGLRRRGIDVTTTQEADILGATDEAQLAFARDAGRVIFTEDADFLIIASNTSNHAGITYARKGTRSIGQIIEMLELIHGTMTAEEMRSHIEYI